MMVATLALLSLAPALRADVTGKWTASFDTQIGVQNYTYQFKVDGTKLTGTAKSDLGECELAEGKVEGNQITFVENVKFQDMPLRIVYKGTINGDEIKFVRTVMEDIQEELVAKRAK
jgi:hypothetical protein